MKISIYTLLLFIKCSSLFSQDQFKRLYEYRYYIDSQIFYKEKIEVIDQRVDSTLVHVRKIIPEKIVTSTANNIKYLIYKAKNWPKVFFIEEKQNKDYKILSSVDTIDTYIFKGEKFYFLPKEIYAIDLEKDGINEIVIKADDIHTPISDYKVLIFRLETLNNSSLVAKVFESKRISAFIDINSGDTKPIVVNTNNIILPYCRNCDDMDDNNDVLKEAEVYFDRDQKKINIIY